MLGQGDGGRNWGLGGCVEEWGGRKVREKRGWEINPSLCKDVGAGGKGEEGGR